MSSGPLHRGMMRLQVADGGDTGHTWRISVNVQLYTTKYCKNTAIYKYKG